MEAELAGAFAQFGVAGLIGWMWLSERRSGAQRDRQLNESHKQLMDERKSVDALLSALERNTKALTLLEASHRELLSYLRSKHSKRDGLKHRAD